jgi:hypothetical protein
VSTIVIPASSGSFTEAPGFGSLTHPENAYAAEADGVFADAFGAPFSLFGFGSIGSDLVPDGSVISEVRVVFSAAKDGPALQCEAQLAYEVVGNWYGDGEEYFSESTQTEHTLTYSSMDLATLRGRTFGATFGATGMGWDSTHTYIDFVRLEIDIEDAPPPPPPPPTPDPSLLAAASSLRAEAGALLATQAGLTDAAEELDATAGQLETLAGRVNS